MIYTVDGDIVLMEFKAPVSGQSNADKINNDTKVQTKTGRQVCM